MHVILQTFKNTINYMTIIILLLSFVGSGFAESNTSIKFAKEFKSQYGKIKDQYKHKNGSSAHTSAHGYRAKF
jgi:hypothetical protein